MFKTNTFSRFPLFVLDGIRDYRQTTHLTVSYLRNSISNAPGEGRGLGPLKGADIQPKKPFKVPRQGFAGRNERDQYVPR